MLARRVFALLFFLAAAPVCLVGPPAVESDASPELASQGEVPPSPQQIAGYCCDERGVRRCILLNPTLVGYPCVCEGPGGGWGWACN